MATALIDESSLADPIAPDRLAWVSQRLAAISFQHWRFELVDNGPDLEPLVVMRFRTVDSTVPGKSFTAEAAYRVDDLPTTEQAFSLWALAAVSSALMHEVAETLKVDGKPVLSPHSPEYRQWDGALFHCISDAARNNGNPFHGVLYAAAAPMVAANAVPPEIGLDRGQCHEHLAKRVAPRRLREPRTTGAA